MVAIGTLLRSADIRRQYGVLVNDSLVAAAAVESALGQLASADPDFDRVKELTRYRPDETD